MTLPKKVIALISITIGFFFFTAAYAQIIYTDVNPDQTCSTDGCLYNLDLNNDGTTDFTVEHALGTGSCPGPCNGGLETTNKVTITPASGNAVAIVNGFCSALTWEIQLLPQLFSPQSVIRFLHTLPRDVLLFLMNACHLRPVIGQALLISIWAY